MRREQDSAHSAAASTRASNRLSHGLTSRSRAADRREEAVALAGALIAGAPRTPGILSCAGDLADIMLLLQAIRAERRSLLSRQSEMGRGGLDAELARFEALAPEDELIADMVRILRPRRAFRSAPTLRPAEEAPPGMADLMQTADIITTRSRELRRVEEYERKAVSRRNRLLNRLDHLILEARRQIKGAGL